MFNGYTPTISNTEKARNIFARLTEATGDRKMASAIFSACLARHGYVSDEFIRDMDYTTRQYEAINQ